MGQTKCAMCNDGQWVVKNPACKECIGFSKWTVKKEIIGYDDTVILDQTKNKPNRTYVIPGGPIYRGHRDGEIWE